MKAAKITIGILLILTLVGFLAYRGVSDIMFNRGCEGHLKRAADANTVELASQELGSALKYIEENNLTSGYTSVIYRTPDEDVGFWYKNLSASAEELRKISPDASQLEKTNVLIKLRETLLDSHEKGMSVTVPDGISIYPRNGIAFLWAIVSILCTLFGAFLIATADDY